MLEALFKTNNIKYVVSVDDCYLTPKQEDAKAKIFSEMCSSIDPFRECLRELGKEVQVKVVDDLTSLGQDTGPVLLTLIEELTENEILRLYELTDHDNSIYDEERRGITEFLMEMQEKGYIEKYWTFHSTMLAANFDIEAENLNAGSILWLLDRNFERVGESADAGINLAKTIVQRDDGRDNFVYVLSTVGQDDDKSEDEIEAEFDDFLFNECDLTIASFVYYISKERVLSKNSKKIAKSLAQGFKRKVCYELFDIYKDCLVDSVHNSKEKILHINQKTLNYLFEKIVNGKGESSFDFLTRLVQIFQSDEYNRSLAGKHDLIADKLDYYGKVCATVKDSDENKEITPILKEFRDVELYNKYINQQHMEISTGDIFQIEGNFYLLVSQSCDTYLRKNGERKLKFGNLLKIVSQKTSVEYKYKLSCFLEYEKPIVLYQEQLNIPFDVLDLCVLNCDGQAKLAIEYLDDERKLILQRCTLNFGIRIKKVIDILKQVYESKMIMAKYWGLSRDVSDECAKNAYEIITNVDPYLKKFDIIDNELIYPIKRVCRLSELVAIDIVRQYGVTLSRIGHPFDFLN